MTIPTIRPSGDEVRRCVARYDELERVTEGLPDQKLPECRRAFMSVLGFKQPLKAGEYSPFGDKVRPKIQHLKAGCGMAYVKAEPGRGVFMHTHDTHETFVVIDGTWKLEWEGDQGDDHLILKPLDVICFPPRMQRRFECVAPAPGSTEGTLLGIIEGDQPVAEMSPETERRLIEAGALTPERSAHFAGTAAA